MHATRGKRKDFFTLWKIVARWRNYPQKSTSLSQRNKEKNVWIEDSFISKSTIIGIDKAGEITSLAWKPKDEQHQQPKAANSWEKDGLTKRSIPLDE